MKADEFGFFMALFIMFIIEIFVIGYGIHADLVDILCAIKNK